MPVQVSKSPNVEFDSDAETALEAVLERLEEQSEHVKSVKVLDNFSIDKLASLQHDTVIVQGLVVNVTKEYVLGEEDVSWFHPNIGAGRSVFECQQFIPRSNFESIELDGLQSSIGSYTTSKPDEFGCETVSHHIIVDSSASAMFGQLHQKWIQTGKTAGEVEKQWKRMQFEGSQGIKNTTRLIRSRMASGIVNTAKEIYSDCQHDILSDSSSVYFTNGAVKPVSNNVLVKASSLGGYRMYAPTNEEIHFYPANLGISSEYYSWGQMSAQNCARIQKSCAWSGDLEFNANVMSGPSISGQHIRSLEDEYEMSFRDTLAMNVAAFSPSDPIQDLLSPEDLIKLHPEHPDSKSYITTPIDMNHPVLQHIMQHLQEINSAHPEFQLFNPDLVEGQRLKIPKELYKEFV